jgi:transposase InsO family protein
VRGQRRDGVVLFVAAKEFSRHPALAHPEELRLAIVSWIETKYHRKRRQRALGKLTPIEFETIYMTAAAA